ncbi:MAG TPA: cell division protein [Candidatus Angelobacter sp.]
MARSVDFHLYSAANTGEQILDGISAGLLSFGDEVQWGARHLGLWLSMRVRITAFQPPNYFQDTMIRGQFRYFRHDHLFEQRGSATEMLDTVKFNSLWIFGRIVDLYVIGPHLRKFLALRNQTLKKVAESDEWRRFLPEASRVELNK